jgi:hypothetical protein
LGGPPRQGRRGVAEMRTAKWASLVVGCMCLASCGIFDVAQQAQLFEEIERLETGGLLSPSVAAAMRDLIQSNGVGPIWQQGVGYVLAAVSAYLGVQWRRGTPATVEERVQRQKARLSAKLSS